MSKQWKVHHYISLLLSKSPKNTWNILKCAISCLFLTLILFICLFVLARSIMSLLERLSMALGKNKEPCWNRQACGYHYSLISGARPLLRCVKWWQLCLAPRSAAQLCKLWEKCHLSILDILKLPYHPLHLHNGLFPHLIFHKIFLSSY